MTDREYIRCEIEDCLITLKTKLFNADKAKVINDNISSQFNHMQLTGDKDFRFSLKNIGLSYSDAKTITRLAELEKSLSECA